MTAKYSLKIPQAPSAPAPFASSKEAFINIGRTAKRFALRTALLLEAYFVYTCGLIGNALNMLIVEQGEGCEAASVFKAGF